MRRPNPLVVITLVGAAGFALWGLASAISGNDADAEPSAASVPMLPEVTIIGSGNDADAEPSAASASAAPPSGERSEHRTASYECQKLPTSGRTVRICDTTCPGGSCFQRDAAWCYSRPKLEVRNRELVPGKMVQACFPTPEECGAERADVNRAGLLVPTGACLSIAFDEYGGRD